MAKYVAKAPPTEYVSSSKPVEQHSELAADFDIDKLLDKGLLILQRDMQNIMAQGVHSKLDGAASRDLVSYIKLLNELKAEKAKDLANMTDEQLAAVAGQEK